MKTAAAYIRVSTHMQEELSPDAQRRLLLEYAKKNHMILPKDFIYVDKGISGKKASKRPSFMEMISRAKQKPAPFEAILVWKFSRFARNQEESIVYKSMLRNKCGIEVISITENIGGDIYGGLIERIIEWMDEFYSIRLAEDVTRGMTENALRGNFQASPALGYKVEQKGKPPVIVPDQAEIVKLIFDKYTGSTMGFYEIARYLNTLGLKTRTGGEFEARGVRYIIQNPIYKGYLRWNRSDANSKKLKDKSEWIIRKGNFEAIIPEETWNLANERLEREYHPRGGVAISMRRHWLSGLVKCSACGATLSTSVQKDSRYGRTYINFQCYRYLKGKCSSNHRISEKKLVPLILNALQEDMGKSYTEYEYAPATSLSSDTHLYEEQMQKLELKKKRIKEAYLDGVDTLEEYKENKKLLEKERAVLEEKLKSRPAEPEPVNMPGRIRGVYDIVSSEKYSTEEKHAAITSVVSKIVFDRENKEISIHYYA